MALGNVPQLNFGVAPAMQLPTGMGDTGNALLQAVQMQQQRQQQQAALKAAQEQQQFTNQMATQKMGMAQQELASQEKARGQQFAMGETAIAKDLAETQRQERQKALLLQNRDSILSAKTPLARTEALRNIIQSSPKEFTFDQMIEVEDDYAKRSSEYDKANMDKKSFAEQVRRTNSDIQFRNMQISKLKQEMTLEKQRAAQAGASGYSPEVAKRFDAQVGHLEKGVEGYRKKIDNLKTVIQKAKTGIISNFAQGKIADTQAVLQNSSLNPKSVDTILAAISNKRDPITLEAFTKLTNDLIIGPAEKQIEGLVKDSKQMEEDLVQTRKETISYYREGIVGAPRQPTDFEAIGQGLSQLGQGISKGMEAKGKSDELIQKRNRLAEKSRRQESPLDIALDSSRKIQLPSFPPYNLPERSPDMGTFPPYNLPDGQHAAPPGLRSTEAIATNVNSFPPFGTAFQDRFNQEITAPAISAIANLPSNLSNAFSSGVKNLKDMPAGSLFSNLGPNAKISPEERKMMNRMVELGLGL